MIEDNYPIYVNNDELGKGIAYLNDYKDNLYVYLDHVELTPDNNICERSAKSFAVGRRNWLFCKSVDGVDASCFFYSSAETAKASGLNPEEYVEFVLTQIRSKHRQEGLRLPHAMECKPQKTRRIP